MVLAVYAHWVCDCIMLGQSSVSQVYCRIFKVKNNDKGQIRLTFYRMNVRIVLNYGVNIYICVIYIYTLQFAFTYQMIRSFIVV